MKHDFPLFDTVNDSLNIPKNLIFITFDHFLGICDPYFDSIIPNKKYHVHNHLYTISYLVILHYDPFDM